MEKKVPPKDESKPAPASSAPSSDAQPKEIGGRVGPEPTRYGDWENKGICSDF